VTGCFVPALPKNGGLQSFCNTNLKLDLLALIFFVTTVAREGFAGCHLKQIG
jgi:hypothetical protein